MFPWLKHATTAPPNYPPAPPGLTVFAVGDIHGRSDLLDRLHSQIDEIAAADQADSVEVYVGDYIDRGPDSAGVITRLARRCATRSVILLKGNHEAALEGFLSGSVSLSEWCAVGGAETLLSYGVPREILARKDAPTVVRDSFRSLFPQAHYRLFGAMKPFHLIGEYLFVHAGIEPGTPLLSQSRETMMWIREPFLGHSGDFGHIVVHGHTPAVDPEFKANRINLDTGAYMTNRLTCIRIGSDGVTCLTPT